MLNFKKTKLTCYYTYLAMSSVFALPPLLFLTFREVYGISYTLLGTLVLINFCTQMAIDLIFTFFTKYFNIPKTVKVMPLITAVGMVIYALSPVLFKNNVYAGLAIGTVIFSVSAGLCEVLLSPLVAAIPSDTPDRDMSMLHSLYAWGVVSVVLLSTLFIKIFGAHNWIYLTLLFALFPLIACVLFCTSPFPEMSTGHGSETKGVKGRSAGMALCVGIIFMGSSAENVMTNWISGFMENAVEIPKIYGDIFGMALFAILLGFGRNLYAKLGKNISCVLFWGMLGAVVCYLAAGFVSNPLIALVFCVLTGFATSMLWPGTLILMEEKIPNPGVAAYALMAAGGDFGASVAPQLMGIVVDGVSASELAQTLSTTLMMTPEQIGMKTGMIITAIFPFVGMLLIMVSKKLLKK